MSNMGITKIEGDEEKQYFLDDPLTYKGKIKIGTGLTMYEALRFTDEHLLELNVPLYLLVGMEDQVSDYEPMKEIFDNHPCEHKILHSPDDMGHYMLDHSEYPNFIKNSAEFLLSLIEK